MSLLNFNIVTNAGLNYITSAYDGGPLIAIKYFLPVYSYEIDPYVHDGSETSVIALSASVSATDTTPTGEKIWNISTDNAYTLSNTDNFVTSAGGETLDVSGVPWILTNAVISKEQKINLYNGVPLSNYVSGSDVDASATSNAWEIYDGVLVTGNNDVPSETSAGSNRYFQVVDYYPVSDGSVLKGSFKCRLNKKIGTVKFNKIALYVVQVDNNGVETSAPSLFAEAVVDSPITKTNYGTSGFEDIVIDVQIQIGSVTTNFSDVFYATSADYWSRTVGGVYYSEKVGIGTFDDGYEEMQAKLHIKESDASKAQLRLDYGIGTSAITSASFHTTSGGDLEIALDETWKAILPPTNGAQDIGTSAITWRDFHLVSAYLDYLRTSNLSYIDTVSMIPNVHNTYNLGSSVRRFANIYAGNLQTSGCYTNYVYPNSNVQNTTASLGAAGRIFKYLFADTLTNPGSDIKLSENLIPLSDERCSLGNSSNIFSAAFVDDLYISKKNVHKVGQWYNSGDFLSYNPNGSNSFWKEVPTGFNIGLVGVSNPTYWDYIEIKNWQTMFIGKTLMMKFLFKFKFKNNMSSKTLELCRCSIKTGSTIGDLLNTIVRDGEIYKDNYHCFPFMDSMTTTNNEVIGLTLRVKYYNTTDSGFDNRKGFCFNLMKSSNTNYGDSAEYKCMVTLTYELS